MHTSPGLTAANRLEAYTCRTWTLLRFPFCPREVVARLSKGGRQVVCPPFTFYFLSSGFGEEGDVPYPENTQFSISGLGSSREDYITQRTSFHSTSACCTGDS